jgi:glycerophosphoryl diester phosphodiesterase
MMKKTMVFGHRGYMGKYPENTLLSFEKAIEENIYGIELDVQRCATGEIVVIHDDSVDRTTDGIGLVSELSYSDLLKLNIEKNQKIPLLTEVLDLINKRVVVNIELKMYGIVEEVANIVNLYINEKKWNIDDFVFSSFNHHDINNLKKNFIPNAFIGALIEAVPIDYSTCATKINANSINIYKETVTKEFIEDAHKKNLLVFCYTLNEKKEIEKFIKLGIDGYFTNFPNNIL